MKTLLTIACSFAFAFAASSVTAAERTLRIGLVQQPNSLDPLHATEFYENYIAEATFSGLVVIDDQGMTVPDLAERVPTRANGGISADNRTLTYHLRPNLRWQDGVALTSSDVRYTLERMRDPATNYPSLNALRVIDRIETPDPRTVRIKLKAPWADATALIFVNGETGAIVPEHLLAKVAELQSSSFESMPVGSGPYAVERWDRGSKIVLRANSYYFRGKPAIARIEIDFVPNQTVLGIRLRTREIDFSPELRATDAGLFAGDARFARAAPATYSDVELTFNLHRIPFNDVRLRRALALAIDRTRIVQTVYHGYGEVADDQLPEQSPYHHRDPAFSPHGDLTRARALLDAAGWRADANGRRFKGGAPLTLSMTFPAGFVAIEADAVQLQATWQSLGIDVTLRPILSNQLFAPVTGTLSRGDFDVALNGDGYPNVPDHTGFILTGDAPPHGLNYARFADREVDGWTMAARKTFDVTGRRALYAKISERVRDQAAPVVPLLWLRRPAVWDATLVGLRPETVNSDLWNVYEWHWR